MIKGAIFDFNGTLYFDHDINYRAWKELFYRITEGKFSFDEEYEKYKTVGNNIFVEHILKLCQKSVDVELIEKLANEKEKIYQAISINENRAKLPKGADLLIDWLKDNGIKLNLATCSLETNIDFYYKYFGIGRWFPRDRIVYGGAYRSKDTMYLKAANNIGVPIENCLIIEDSIKAIEDAIKVGCNDIIYINSRNIPFKNDKIILTTSDYTKIDYDYLYSVLMV